jgi:hypothetical protein
MMDYIKLSTKDQPTIEKFRNDSRLQWLSSEDKFNRFDREIINTKNKFHYKGIIFCFYPNELKISFFPHYYNNNNLHNANDFKITDCIKVVSELINSFNVDWEKLNIINIEFGINIISPIDIKDLITFLSYHNQNAFITDNQYPFSKKSYSTNKRGIIINDYKSIKAYAKGIQFPDYCDKNTFRFEVKSDQSKYFNRLGIFTIKDLLNVEIYETLSATLIEEFQNILLLDYGTDISNLTEKEKLKFRMQINPNYWYKLKQENQRNRFNKEKKIFKKLLDKTGNHLKKQLDKIVFEKLEYLKSGAVSSIIYSGNCTEIKSITCKITGLNISMQKSTSVLLSHSGLKYYFENDNAKFEKIKKRFLSNRWHNSKFETQIKEIAHNIRNTNSNQGIKQNRIYKTAQIRLFDW